MWKFRLWLSQIIEPKRPWTIGYVVKSYDEGRVLVISPNAWYPNDKMANYIHMNLADLVITTDGRVLKSRYGVTS